MEGPGRLAEIDRNMRRTGTAVAGGRGAAGGCEPVSRRSWGPPLRGQSRDQAHLAGFLLQGNHEKMHAGVSSRVRP